MYEARDGFGGKARSMPVPGSGTGGRADLPAEHGFRFFPGFYRHLPGHDGADPARRGARAADHLVPATRILLAQGGGRDELIAPGAGRPRRSTTWRCWSASRASSARARASRRAELALFVERLLTLLTSCDERRLEQWERASWWEYIGAERRTARRSRSSSPTG